MSFIWDTIYTFVTNKEFKAPGRIRGHSAGQTSVREGVPQSQHYSELLKLPALTNSANKC